MNDIPAPPPEKKRFGFVRISPKSPKEALQPQMAPPPPPRDKLRKHPFVSFASNFLTWLLVIGAVIATAAWYIRGQLEGAGPLAADKIVIVRGGASEIADQLETAGVIRDRWLFMAGQFLARKENQSLRGGEYQFPQGATLQQVIAILVEGKPIQHGFTVPEGLTSEQIVARMMETDTLSGTVRELPPEGSLLPDTYKFDRGFPRQKLIEKMQADHKRVIEEIWRKRASDLPIKSPRELVILASIVEKETGRADERQRVAGVFVNRLNRRMKLESDPTIVYGLVGGKGTLGRPILRDEIRRPTPYNTYVIEGLPPGPIANPGKASIEAVANPARTRDIFFVADGTGGHAFAETLDQHNRNVERWRQIERAKASTDSATKPVDRVETPAEAPVVPARRSELPGQAPSSFTALPAQAEPPVPGIDQAPSQPRTTGTARRPVTDAVAGTPKDPLLNRSFDLNTPKTVPALRP